MAAVEVPAAVVVLTDAEMEAMVRAYIGPTLSKKLPSNSELVSVDYIIDVWRLDFEVLE